MAYDERVGWLLDEIIDYSKIEIDIEVTWSIWCKISHHSRGWHGYIR